MMKKTFTRIVPLALAVMIGISAFGARAGESLQKQHGTEPVTAIAEKNASPATENAAEQQVTADISPETVESAQPQKVHLTSASAITSYREEAKQKEAQGNDEEVITLFDFISNLTNAIYKGMYNSSFGVFDLGGKFPEFAGVFENSSGNPQVIKIGMYYDEKNRIIIGKNEQGAFGFGFDVDLKQKMMYASLDTWTRKLGFCSLYDAIAPALGVNYKTERIKFEYDGLDWMIQIWKGKYFAILSGAEMGIYNKPKERVVEFYDCIGDEDMLDMSMRLSKGNTVIFERGPEKHWWMNGFAVADIFNRPEDLTLEGSILFEDEKMKQAFLSAFDKVCKEENISYTIDGMLISYIW